MSDPRWYVIDGERVSREEFEARTAPDPATITLAQQAWTRAFKGAIGRLLFGEQKKD